MIRIKQIRYYAIRMLLFSLYMLFYFIMVSVNWSRVEEYIDPFSPFKTAPFQVNSMLYSGSYLNNEGLTVLLKEKGVKRVICLLDPRFPLIRELVAYERENCKRLGITFISLPQRDFTRYSNMLPVVMEILDEEKEVTYIHTYFMNRWLLQLTAGLESH